MYTHLQQQFLLSAPIVTNEQETRVLSALTKIPSHFPGVFDGLSVTHIEGALLHFAHKCIHSSRRGAMRLSRRQTAPSSNGGIAGGLENAPNKAHLANGSSITFKGHPTSSDSVTPMPNTHLASSATDGNVMSFPMAYGFQNLSGMEYARNFIDAESVNASQSSFATL